MTETSYWKIWRMNNADKIDAYNKRTKEHRSQWSKERNQEQKKRILEALGGECAHCHLRYDGTNASVFDAHHVNPEEKEFNFGGAKKAWALVEEELKKCILLCSNCHRMQHSEAY